MCGFGAEIAGKSFYCIIPVMLGDSVSKVFLTGGVLHITARETLQQELLTAAEEGLRLSLGKDRGILLRQDIDYLTRPVFLLS